MSHKATLTPGAISIESGSLNKTKEDIRLDSIIPADIFENKDKLQKFLEAYYTFMNMDEFIYQEDESFNEVVLNNQVQFRIPDPNNENNRFFTDEDGANSTLVLTSPSGTTVNISLTSINVAITNGNELPGTLIESTSEIGKTFTVNGLSSYNNYTAKLTTIVKYWVGPGPSYVMNTIEEAMDIDLNANNYLELMQKEIAATIPRAVTVNKRNLYKQIIDFYKLRGSSDSIEIFFKILFNDFAEVEFPYDQTLIPSSGNWDVNPALSKGGQYLDNKGFLSDSIKIQDSLKFQKFSYLIKTGKNLSDWELAYDRLVHPAGFIYFAEILIILQLTKAVLGEDNFDSDDLRFDGLTKAIRKVLSALPTRQPGIIGPEDVPVLVEMFASVFLPTTEAKIHKTGTLSVDLKSGVINGITDLVGGSGYTSAPTITTSDAGTPSGFTTATLTPTITNGAVTAIAIGNGGKDYNTAVITIAAPSAITFDGSDDEVLGSGIVNINDNTIKLTSAQQSALPVGSLVTYSSGGGTSIGGLVDTSQYYIISSTGGKVKVSATEGGSEIDITSVGSGTSHSFTGETATANATTLDGALETISIVEPGFGYSSAPSITFSGIEISNGSGVAPTVTIGIDSDGRLDQDNVTINTEGSGWSALFATVAANTNAGSIATVNFFGLADKNYSTAPTIVFPQPQSKDADGNLLNTNVLATAEFTLDSDGEINGVNITEAGSGYIDDPIVKLGSTANNETRVADQQEILVLSLNHNDVNTLITEVKINPVQSTGSIMTSTESADKFLPESRVKVVNSNFRTIINNNYKQRKGTNNFYTSPRLFNTNQTIEFLGNKTLQTIDSTDINNNNTSTFVHIE